MSAPEQFAPATGHPLAGQSADAGGIATPATARPAQSFPADIAAHGLLVRRAMSVHVIAAEDLMKENDLDSEAAMAIAIQGLKDATRVLEQRQRMRAVANQVGGG